MKGFRQCQPAFSMSETRVSIFNFGACHPDLIPPTPSMTGVCAQAAQTYMKACNWSGSSKFSKRCTRPLPSPPITSTLHSPSLSPPSPSADPLHTYSSPFSPRRSSQSQHSASHSHLLGHPAPPSLSAASPLPCVRDSSPPAPVYGGPCPCPCPCSCPSRTPPASLP